MGTDHFGQSQELHTGIRALIQCKVVILPVKESHCGDKMSYLHNGISYTGKTTSLY